jgi:hypothetical protein
MGAFCVFGISKAACKAAAERALPSYEIYGKVRRELTMEEWRVKRDAMAAQLFEEGTRPIRISPEFDAPQFCYDRMAAGTAEIKLTKVMVRGPKRDKGGALIKRNGVTVMTWHEFTGINQFKGVANEA